MSLFQTHSSSYSTGGREKTDDVDIEVNLYSRRDTEMQNGRVDAGEWSNDIFCPEAEDAAPKNWEPVRNKL
jgi:hypothetical protein